MGRRRRGGAVAIAAVLAAVLAIPQSGSVAAVPAPVDPPRAQVELGALERAATPLPAGPAPLTVPWAAPGSAASLPTPPDVAVPQADLLDGGIPVRVLAAYRRAADRTAAADPGCGLDWALLAGIGRIESGHAAGGRVDAAGTTRGRILGPVLDGSLAGSIVVADTDGGALDGDTRFDRATGPMQFLPATWRSAGADANVDGVADADNVDDAALGAARYLCAGGGDLSTVAGATAALYRYNRSASYGAAVLAWAQAYRTGVTAVPDLDGPVPAADPGPQALAAAEGAPGGSGPAVVPVPPAGPVGPARPPAPPTSTTPADPGATAPAVPPVTTPPVTTPPVTTPPGTDAPVSPLPVSPPVTPAATTPQVTAVVTPPPVTTPPVAKDPVTPPPATPPAAATPPATTPPVTKPVATTPPAAEAPVPPPGTTAPHGTTTPPGPVCPAATVAASTVRALPDAAGLLVRFVLPPLPTGCRMTAATLRLDPGAPAATLTVRRPTVAWTATTADEPASVGPDVVSAATAGPRRVTVTALVAALYAGPDHGLLVLGTKAPPGRVRLTVTFGS